MARTDPHQRVAVVTGASSGIGRACAEALARKSFAVALTARRAEKLAEARDRIRDAGGLALDIPGDITDPDHREHLLGQVLDQWGRVDVWVNNAGRAYSAVVEEADPQKLRSLFELNLFSHWHCMQLVGPVMRRQGSGRILNMSSISGVLAFPGLGPYAASKFALEAMSDAARLEYAPFGLKVILIQPGPVATDIWETSLAEARKTLPAQEQSAFSDLYEVLRDHAEQMAREAGCTPEQVADVVLRAATTSRPKPRYCLPASTRRLSWLRLLPTGLRDRLILRGLGREYERNSRPDQS